MAEHVSWQQHAVDRFFGKRALPTQAQCNEIARSLTGASDVIGVDTPGSTSYTVICGGASPVVVSFREPGASINTALVSLAREIHGNLVPEATQHGTVIGSDPLLSIYTMPFVPGVSCVQGLAYEAELDEKTEAQHSVYIRHLARYFARCWMSPQPVASAEREALLGDIKRRLGLFSHRPSALAPALTPLVVADLETCLPLLFEDGYRQVLTHGDLSLTNVLVDQDTLEITGIVDWSMASARPFGMELDSLFLMTGCTDRSGWHDYSCHERLHSIFWEEFWSLTGVGESQKQDIRHLAGQAARIGAILRYAFQRNDDGSPSDTFMSDRSMSWGYLQAWFS